MVETSIDNDEHDAIAENVLRYAPPNIDNKKHKDAWLLCVVLFVVFLFMFFSMVYVICKIALRSKAGRVTRGIGFFILTVMLISLCFAIYYTFIEFRKIYVDIAYVLIVVVPIIGLFVIGMINGPSKTKEMKDLEKENKRLERQLDRLKCRRKC